MKKQFIICAILGTLCGICLAACAKQGEDKKKDDKGCGCQSSENILDLRGTTEKATDGLMSPAAKL